MLACLSFWRQQCNEIQLAEFDRQLKPNCATVVSQNILKNRYQESYHRGLVNNKIIRAAIRTGEREHQDAAWSYGADLGEILTHKLADQGGYLATDRIEVQFQKSLAILLQRGVLFEHDGHYCLPAEMVMDLRSKEIENSWLTLIAHAPLPILSRIVPADAQRSMHQAKATRTELAAWLAVHGERARNSDVQAQLDDADWSLLLDLQHNDIIDFNTLHHRYPDMQRVQIKQHYFYDSKQITSLRKSLEEHIPEPLCKLCRLGLIAIDTGHGDQHYAAITLCAEGKSALSQVWHTVRQRRAKQVEKQWLAEPCHAEQPSPWSMDQQIWRLWIALHYLPLGITQQNKLRKNDIRKIASTLNSTDPGMIEFLVASMQRSGLLKQHAGLLQPAAINWPEWSGRMRSSIYEIVHGWERWSGTEEKKALGLLAELPVDCWLKLDEVVDWLRMQSDGRLVGAHWMSLFTEHQTLALHHLNTSRQCIYLLPLFRTALNQKPPTFAAPGWYGADKKAKIHGFISAAGEIQLPPDCNHSILAKLAAFCTITSVEQMITLQLDTKALQRMGTDKAALNRNRRVLESVQSPLPQAVAYLFDKQQAQKAVASVAATSLLMVLNEPSAIHSLRKTGFNFSQPFKEKPELLLLDASADAHAFVRSCAESGIMLETLIKPVQWISGTASVKAWMEINVDREEQWLEVCYQKTRSSKPKQVIACIENDFYDRIEIRAVRNTKQGFDYLKSTVTLEPKHILRLRELDQAEVTEMGLDKLV